MQATPEFVLPTNLALAVLVIFAVTLAYKWARLTGRQFPFRGEGGFYYRLGRRGRMSEHQVIWEWFTIICAVLGLVLCIQSFFQALTNPTGLVFNTLGNLLYLISFEQPIISVVWSMLLLLLSWLMSEPECIFG